MSKFSTLEDPGTSRNRLGPSLIWFDFSNYNRGSWNLSIENTLGNLFEALERGGTHENVPLFFCSFQKSRAPSWLRVSRWKKPSKNTVKRSRSPAKVIRSRRVRRNIVFKRINKLGKRNSLHNSCWVNRGKRGRPLFFLRSPFFSLSLLLLLLLFCVV